MGIYSFKPTFRKFLRPLKKLCIRLDLKPNHITAAGLLISLATGVVIYYSGQISVLLLLAPIGTILRLVLNALDGMVAEELKITSKFGEVLNEYFDRLSDIAIFVGLAFSKNVNNTLGLEAVVAVLLTSYIGIVGKAAGGRRQYGGFVGKADRMLYLGIMSIIVFIYKKPELWDYFLYFLITGSALTIVQRWKAITMELKK